MATRRVVLKVDALWLTGMAAPTNGRAGDQMVEIRMQGDDLGAQVSSILPTRKAE